MKNIPALLAFVIFISSCAPSRYVSSEGPGEENEPSITQSLFNDKSSTISEENIQKILDGTYTLPKQLRVAVIKLESQK